ncbi:MAG: acyl-CoA dehydratase activase [Syntrophobacteraceae bacterium]
MQHIDCGGLSREASQLGVDVGASYLKAVAIDSQGNIAWTLHQAHEGNPLPLLDQLEAQSRRLDIPMGVTGSFNMASYSSPLDSVLCLHAAARRFHPSASNILEVGAAHFCLVRLNRKGEIQSIQTNPLCAAGTGSFLDAQAARMGVDYKSIDCCNIEEAPPTIATRCAVFAKSDLIHRQQEGFDIPSLWSGLCLGLAEGLLHTLTQGSPLSGETLLCGGVALNQTFVVRLNSLLNGNGNGNGNRLALSPHPHLTAALGAGLLSRSDATSRKVSTSPANSTSRTLRPPLTLKKSRPPQRQAFFYEIDSLGNEITVYRRPSLAESNSPVFMGIDIGSTSTKMALVDSTGELMVDIYRRTQSDPIAATRSLFAATLALNEKLDWKPVIRGAGTTGSGRKLIGEIIGADLIINEISAHAAGALRIEPNVETIFEIGGQDAKYIRIQNGRIVDANMNYVCAAGTGSFIEELCFKLGYRIEEMGEEILGVAPPYINSRCTVFMEQDIHALIREGTPRHDAAGAIIYSVIENYLHRVVGKRPVNGNRILFLGATARNLALTAAIERILDREVVVSQFPHAMGAYGTALLVQSAIGGGTSKFKGLDLATRRIDIERETCKGCRNRCELTRAVIEGEKNHQLWGMKCGRDENAKSSKKLATYEQFQKRCDQISWRSSAAKVPSSGKRIVMPAALSTYSLGPFWSEFFSRIGVELIMGPQTNEAILQSGRQVSGSEFCLPLKTALGHIAHYLEKNAHDPLFVPHMIADYQVEGLTQTRFCPYVEVLPSLIRPMGEKKGYPTERIISPVIDLRLSDEKNAKAMAESLRPLLLVREKDIVNALRHAHRIRRQLNEDLQAAAQACLSQVSAKGRPAIVMVGRPYNTLDPLLSHKLPYEIAASGLDVLHMDSLPFRPELLEGYFRNQFWAYGQKILSALIQISHTDGLYPVYLSSFGCGPDSFIISYAEHVMGDKPLLILELDEHGSSGGYQTRLEAFLEVVKADNKTMRRSGSRTIPKLPTEVPPPENIRERRLYVPHMHPTGSRLLAAALRGEGYTASELPLEDDASFAEGRKWMRGSECLPTPLTLGSFLKIVEKEREKDRDPNTSLALFMPTSDGPCRFGQYCALDRIVLDRVGCRDLPIMSPSSENAYYGIDDKAFEYMLFSDILFKLRCRTKPRETTRGDTEEALELVMKRAERAIEDRTFKMRSLLPEAVRTFQRIPVGPAPRLLVGVVGEIYVRSNTFANNRLVDTVERLGGEAWVATTAEWIMYTAWVERLRLRRAGMSPWQAARLALRWRFMKRWEHEAYKLAAPLLADRTDPPLEEVILKGRRFLPPEFEGESILTLGRAALFKRDGVGLIVNCGPFGCMHGNITSALFSQAADEIDIPVVDIAYDGVGDSNSVLETFMKAALRKTNNIQESRN